jgi:two-component system phosphate regulon sensor histidine kinase PhoR
MKNNARYKAKGPDFQLAAHELKAPLTAIKGFVCTLMVDDFSAEERQEFCAIIDEECDRLLRLIDELLRTRCIESVASQKPCMRSVQIRPLFERVKATQERRTACHSIVLDTPTGVPTIVADEDKLEQALTNLVDNAIKYSPNGGTIKLTCTEDRNGMLFSVQDEGLGIPQKNVSRVFERFHRVKNKSTRKIGGTGLGLYLVKRIIEGMHRGKIWVETQPGKGSTFFFRIPLNDAPINGTNHVGDRADRRFERGHGPSQNAWFA